MRKIDSRNGEIPGDATKDEVFEDQHRPITKKEKEISEKILKEYKSRTGKK